MLDKLVHHFLINIAQSLVKYANGLEAYLSKDYVSEKESVANNLTNAPPAHWIEKVRQGAPHLLDQIEYTDDSELYSFQIKEQLTEDLIPPSDLVDKRSTEEEPDLFFHRVKESGIQYECETPEHEGIRLKKKNVYPQLYLFKKITKAVRFLNIQNKHAREVSLQPIITTEKGVQRSGSKFNWNTTRKSSNPSTNNKITAEIETKLTTPFVSLKIPNRRIEKEIKHTVKNKKKNSQNRNGARFNKIKQQAVETRTVQEVLGLCEGDLLKNKKTVHLYPKSIVQDKVIKFTGCNGINATKIESSKQDCSTHNKVKNSFLSDDLQQLKKTTSRDKNTILSDSHKIQQITSKPDVIGVIQPVKTSNASYLKITSKNNSHKTKVSSASSEKWTDVVNETTDLINQDRWPQLPNQQQIVLSETLNQHFDFWRVQTQAESKFLSDQEQRGRLWNA